VTNQDCILAIDQGTSSTKGVLLDLGLAVRAAVSVPVNLDSPQPGWVEQDPTEIWQSALAAALELLEAAAAESCAVQGIAITNQRESALAWDAVTGEPLSAMLGWQDRRTASSIDGFSAATQVRIREITGLPLDPMFSALKFAWILDQIDPDRSRSRAGEIALGTVDSWLVYNLTGQHVIEVGNASRTQLLKVATGDWSTELLETFNIPAAALPAVVGSDFRAEVTLEGSLKGLEILGILADSHAALYAHHASDGASVKATFGTGSSIMALGVSAANEGRGLVRTIAWGKSQVSSKIADIQIQPALEGNILSSGSTLIWLGKLLGRTPNELDQLARTATSQEVNLVPAFGGLGAPWWDPNAQAIIDGMSLATGAAELALAGFEAIALQIEDVLAAVESETGAKLLSVNVDGGPTSNDWLMQLQANLSQRTVVKNQIAELSAVGVAVFAAQAAGLLDTVPASNSISFTPQISADRVAARQATWHSAVTSARNQPNKPINRTTGQKNN
jgi:glycerol kinase